MAENSGKLRRSKIVATIDPLPYNSGLEGILRKWLCFDLVGAIGFEPTTPCAQVVIPRFLPITAAVSKLFGKGCLCGFVSILPFCRFHSVSGTGPYSFHYMERTTESQ
jgi:hypothetical protein